MPAVDVSAELTAGMSRLIVRHDRALVEALRQQPAALPAEAAALWQWLRGEQPAALLRHPAGGLLGWVGAVVHGGETAVAYLPLLPTAETHREDVALPLLAARLAHLFDADLPFSLDGRAARDAIREMLHAPPRPLLIVLAQLDQADFSLAGLLPAPLPPNLRVLATAAATPATAAADPATAAADPALWLARLGWQPATTALLGWPAAVRSQEPPAPAQSPISPSPNLAAADRPAPPNRPSPHLPAADRPSPYRSPTTDPLAAALPRLLRAARQADAARQLSPTLLRLGAAEGLLPPTQALQLAQSQPDPARRADALLALLETAPPGGTPDAWPTLPTAAREAALAVPDAAQRARRLARLPGAAAQVEAVAAAQAITDPAARAETLAAIAAWSEALTAVSAIGTPADAAALLTRLAPDLPAAQHAAAVRLAQAFPANGRYAADALCALAPHLADDAVNALCQWVWRVDDAYVQVRVAACLARRLEGEAQAQWMARTRQAAAAVSYPSTRVELWTTLAPLLPEAERLPLLAELWQLAQTIDRPVFRAEALGQVALRLPAAQRDEKLAAAAAALADIPDSFTRDRLWGAWARVLCRQPDLPSVEAGLALFDHMGSEYLCVVFLKEVAPRLARLPAAQVVPAVRRLLRTPTNRAGFWREVLPHFPPAFDAPLQADLAALDDKIARRIGLAALAPRLEAAARRALVQQLLAEAGEENGRSSRPVLLAGLARQLPARRAALLDAAQAGLARWDAVNQAHLLADMLVELGEAAPAALRAQALAAVTALDAPAGLHVWPGLLAGALPAERAGWARRALQAILAVEPSLTRTHRLLDVLPYLDAADVAALWPPLDALGEPLQWPGLLRAAAPHLPPPRLEAALDRLIGLPLAQMSVLAAGIAELAPHLGPEQLELAQLAVDEMRFPGPRIQAQAALAARLPEPARGERLAVLLAAARETPVDVSRAAALVDLAAHLPAAQQPDVLREALAVIAQLDDESMRVHRLLPLAPLAPPELAGDVLQAILAIGRDDDRARLLTAVTPRLAPAQLGALLPLAAQFAEPYPFQALLAAVVARLPAAWLPEALRLVHARAGVLLPPTALAAVMARWDDLTAVAGVDAEAELVLTLEAFARGGSAFLLAALRVLLPRLAHVDGGLPGRLADELVARES